jgi:hypothetical protein
VFWLAIATILLSIFVIIGSALAFGRILADLEYQTTAGLNGVRRIQSHVGLRTHGKRILLGLFGLVLGIMGVTTLDIVWQYNVGGLLFILILILFGASSVLDWFAERESVRILLLERESYLAGMPHEPKESTGDPLPPRPHDDSTGIYTVGPAGPAGAQGPTGPQGVMGPVGPAGEPA